MIYIMEPEYSGLFTTTIILVFLARVRAVGYRLMKPNHCEQQIQSYVEYYSLEYWPLLSLDFCAAVILRDSESHIDSTRLHFILDVNYYLFIFLPDFTCFPFPHRKFVDGLFHHDQPCQGLKIVA